MKRTLFWLLAFAFAAGIACAQDSGMQQQIDQLRGQLQDLIDAQAVQAKRLDALERDLREVRDKSSGGAGANAEDLQKLAEQVQEIDKKRQEDRTLILKEIEKLGKIGAGSPSGRKPPTVSTAETSSAAGAGPQKGYNYTIQRGDTLLAIVRAYGDKGIKVTTDQILKANPGLEPKNMIVGKTIFIPAPTQ
jgi:phage tail protein X